MANGINIDTAGLGSAVSSIGTLLKDIRAAITGKAILDPEKQAEIEMKLAEIDAQTMNAQATINAAEAASPSLFISGWRPFVGWTGGIGFAYQFVLGPILAAFGVPFVSLNMDALMTMLFGILGLGTARTIEKLKGAEGNR